MKLLIIAANNTEDIELTTTNDLLKRSGIEVDIACEGNEIRTAKGLKIVGLNDIRDINPSDYKGIVIPGGPGFVNLDKDIFKEITTHFKNEDKLIAAICAAPSLLIKWKLIENQSFTCYPGYEKGAEERYTSKSVTQDKNLITGKGPGATFDFALKIIEHFKGKEKSSEIAKKAEYYI